MDLGRCGNWGGRGGREGKGKRGCSGNSVKGEVKRVREGKNQNVEHRGVIRESKRERKS